jgi:uncharacterized protein
MIVPIFPLPNVVLFPKTFLPLYIFEDRYQAMVRAVLEGDRRIVLVLLREGREEHEGKPTVHRIACLGEIATVEELEDGKFNVVLAGLHRVRLLRELESSAPYRVAEVQLIKDEAGDEEAQEIMRRRNRLGAMFTRYMELMNTKAEPAQLVPRMNFEMLVNTVASTLNVTARDRQALLETNSLLRRCDLLIPVLRRQLQALVLVRRYEGLRPAEPKRN